MAPPTRVAVALGGGGARGYAHIGVMEVLDERGFHVAGVSGASMGAVIGGLYAAGRLQPYTEWVRTLTYRDVFRLLDPTFRAPGAIRAEKVLDRMRELLGDIQIENLPIHFTAVATDLVAHKPVWFQRGPLDVAIRASMALPTFITPVVLNGRILVDGGLIDPVPITPMAAVGADVTIAVSLSGAPAGTYGSPTTESSEERPVSEWREKSRRTTSMLLDHEALRALWARFGREDSEVPPQGEGEPVGIHDLSPGLGMGDLVNLSIEAMQAVITRYRMAGSPPDLLISIPKDACGTLDFHQAKDLIEIGRQEAAKALDEAGVI